ncbi:MAG: general secretion pathway protein GspL [Comamonadaceae bacterium]|nr:MAG: general secretion pathway protein GspL [Comamonadaceae bacterium]
MALLLVQPPAPSAPPGADHAWAEGTSDRQRLTAQGTAPVTLLPGHGEVTVVVPAAALSWHSATLPPGSLAGGRQRHVLAGLLEDRLLDDPEQLHFALEPGARTGAPVWVATCRKAWLQDVVQTLESAGRRVSRLLPEFTPRPDEAPTALNAIGTPEAGQWVLCDAGGVLSLPLSAEGLAMLGPLPDDLAVAAEPAVAELAESLLGRPVPLQPAAQRWLDSLASPWDLAQFEFATTGRARAGKQLTEWARTLWRAPRWRAARWGAGLLVAAQLIGVNAWAWKERNALDAKRQAVQQVLRSTFPAVQLVVDAPLQMQREVAALQQATGGVTPADLEPMLAALSLNLPAGRVPTAIDYSGGQLRLRGLGLTVSELDALNRQMAPRGYQTRGEGDVLLMQAAC